MLALVRHHGYADRLMLPEAYIDGGAADLLMVTKAGYTTEFEIKVTRQDWLQDREKDKWKWRARPNHVPRVNQFYYVVPEALAERPPIWLPDGNEIGIIKVIDGGETFDHLEYVRYADRRGARKLSPVELANYTRRYYYKFWSRELRRMYQRHANEIDRMQRASDVLPTQPG